MNNLKTLVNHTNDLMWSVDKNFKLITSNQPFDDMTNAVFGSKMIKGRNVLSLGFSPEKLSMYKSFYLRAFAGEAFTEIEYTETPFETWSETSYHPILDGDKVIGTACHSRDITKRKLVEEKLIKNEARLNEAQSIGRISSWEIDLINNIHTWSDELYKMYGLNKHETEPSTELFLSFVHPEDNDEVRNNVQRSFDNLKDSFHSFRFIRKDGVLRHGYTERKYEFDKNGKPIRFYGIVQDVTEIRETERQLRKSEAFNRGVLNSLSSQIAVVEGSGTIVAVNDSWTRFAKENGDVHLQRTSVGNNYFEVCKNSIKAGFEQGTEVLQGMKDVMSGKRAIYYLEYPCHSPLIKQWFGIRVMKFDSKELMLVIAHQDITERKISEEELIRNNIELQKTNSELDRFVYSTSHDLRSPLTSMLGLVNFIEKESKESETVTYAKMIKTSIERLDGFIKNILYYSRNNRTELEIKQIPLRKTIDEIIHSMQYIEDAKEINFEIDITKNHPFFSDHQRFSAVIENLISNAIKYQNYKQTDRYVKVSVHSNGDYLYLQVSDNGIGIAPKFIDKIFDMFFRIPGKMAGTGIGLYIVKENVEKLSGLIEVQSIEELGTTFSLKLKNLATNE